MKIQKKQVLLAVIMALGLAFPLAALASNYYDISDDHRPPSAFAKCCCSIQNENQEQVFYVCELKEECNENEKKYPGLGIECPGNLIFTKYKK